MLKKLFQYAQKIKYAEIKKCTSPSKIKLINVLNLFFKVQDCYVIYKCKLKLVDIG